MQIYVKIRSDCITEARYKAAVYVGNTIGDMLILHIAERVECQCIHCKNLFYKTKSDLEFGHKIYCPKCNPRNKVYGNSYKKLYSIWREMNRRCYSPKCKNYAKYGAKGICVFDEWKRKCDGNYNGFHKFEKWALENGYRDGLTLDRANPYKNYTPDNCRWVDYYTQNTHLTINNKNTSGYIGIGWYDRKGQRGWRSRLKIHGKEKCIGVYKNKKDAVDARNEFILNNNLPHTIQEWVGEEGYNKENYNTVYQ